MVQILRRSPWQVPTHLNSSLEISAIGLFVKPLAAKGDPDQIYVFTKTNTCYLMNLQGQVPRGQLREKREERNCTIRIRIGCTLRDDMNGAQQKPFAYKHSH